MYAPGLGFLMFAVGVNLQLEAFAHVFQAPQVGANCLMHTQTPTMVVHAR